MKNPTELLPSDLAAAHAMILAERAARVQAEAVAALAQEKAATVHAKAAADLSRRDALITHLRLEIEKLRRSLYGNRSERKARLLEQMELQLEELEASAGKPKWQRRPRQPKVKRIDIVEFGSGDQRRHGRSPGGTQLGTCKEP